MRLGKPRVLFCESQLCAVVASFDGRRLELAWLKAGVRKRRSVRAVGEHLLSCVSLRRTFCKPDLKRLRFGFEPFRCHGYGPLCLTLPLLIPLYSGLVPSENIFCYFYAPHIWRQHVGANGSFPSVLSVVAFAVPAPHVAVGVADTVRGVSLTLLPQFVRRWGQRRTRLLALLALAASFKVVRYH